MRKSLYFFVAALVSLVAAITSPVGPPAPVSAQASGPGRTVTLTRSSGLVNDDIVTVSWSGFSPGPAYVMQCRRGSTEWRLCSDATRLSVTTGADGTGSSEFRVRSGTVTPQYNGVSSGNPLLQCFGGSTPVACDMVVTECEFDVAAVRTAREPLDFVAPFPLASATSDIRPPPIVRPPQPPPPAPSTTPLAGPEISGIGSSSTRMVVEQWQNAVRQAPWSRSVDVTTINSPTALDYLVPNSLRPRTQDFALSAQPMEGARLAALRAAGRDVVHIPLSVSALAFGTRASYSVFWRERVNLTPAIIAGMYEREIVDWGHPAITDANGGCGLTTNAGTSPVFPVLRGDQSAATLALTSWLQARAPEAYAGGAREILSILTSGTRSANSAAEVARLAGLSNYDSASEIGTDNPPGPFVRLGYGDHAYMRRFAVTEVALQNAAGRFVLPTAESVDLAARDLDVSADGVTRVDYTNEPVEGAYPVVQVNYAVVPTALAPDRADVLHDFISYALSDHGQKDAEDLGHFRLPPGLRAAALRNLARLPTTANQPSTTTTTTTTTTTVTATTATTGATNGPGKGTAAAAPEDPATAASPAPASDEAGRPGAAAADSGEGTTLLADARSGDDSVGASKPRAGVGREAGGEAGGEDEAAAGPGAPRTVVRPIAGESFAGSVFGLSIPLVFLLGCIAVALGRLPQLRLTLSGALAAVRRRRAR